MTNIFKVKGLNQIKDYTLEIKKFETNILKVKTKGVRYL